MFISNNNMTHIIHSRNLFIDTSTGSGKGDEFNLELGANQISAADGQFLRLTLVSFNMYNNIYPVNSTNNQFRVVSRYGSIQDASQFLGISTVNSITPKTYRTVGEIALAFAQSVQAQVQADARVAAGNNSLTTTLSGITTTDVQPPTGETFGQQCGHSNGTLSVRRPFILEGTEGTRTAAATKPHAPHRKKLPRHWVE